MLAMEQTAETIILMGGPCSGRTYIVPVESTVITAHDAAGASHEYVRTALTVDADDGQPWTVFRRAEPSA